MTMLAKTAFIGVDPSAGRHPIVYAALDGELRLLALGQGDIDQVLAFLAGHHQAIAGVCAPRRPGIGLMADQAMRDQLNPPPKPGRWMKYRVVEYQLRMHRISTYRTPSSEDNCPAWMKIGFNLYRRLEALGFKPFNPSESPCQSMEVYPHASFTVLLGLAPFPKNSLEGRIQRQLVLYEQGINVPDPIRFFEEITRHRLLNGILPDENLYSARELDALVAAFTTWTAALRPNEVVTLGHPDEGQIILPTGDLKSRYRS